jgi:hypothetical protein
MHYFLDTEFNEFGGDLISLALVSEDGERELYLYTNCAAPGDWVRANVIPFIRVVGAIPRIVGASDFGFEIAKFLADDPGMPQIVADWPDDIRYFCQTLITGPGEMVNIPALSFHLRRVDAYPTTLEGAVQHNALWDARALRHCLTVES